MGIRIMEGGEQVVPYSPQAQDEGLPASLACPQYDLVHYPLDWSWDDTDGFLPNLGQLAHAPGVNGVRDMGKDRNGAQIPPDATAARAGTMRKGGLLIRPDDQRLGEYKNFLRRLPCKGGGYFYFFIDTQVQVWGPGDGQHRVTPSPKWNPFRRFLRDGGIIGQISDVAYDKLRSTVLAELESRRNVVAASAEAERKVLQSRLDAMDKAWKKLQSKAATVPVVSGEGEVVL